MRVSEPKTVKLKAASVQLHSRELSAEQYAHPAMRNWKHSLGNTAFRLVTKGWNSLTAVLINPFNYSHSQVDTWACCPTLGQGCSVRSLQCVSHWALRLLHTAIDWALGLRALGLRWEPTRLTSTLSSLKAPAANTDSSQTLKVALDCFSNNCSFSIALCADACQNWLRVRCAVWETQL